jgi:spore photoproduct lyase
MYTLKPPAVFVHKRVFRNAHAVKRLERMLKAMGDPPVEEVDTAGTEMIVERAGIGSNCPAWSDDLMNGFLKPQGDPVIVFNTFVWDESKREAPDRKYKYHIANRLAWTMAGAGEDFAYSRREIMNADDCPPRSYVCQGGWGLHSLNGCVHRCAYCDQAFIMTLMLDLEDFADNVSRTLVARPHQKLYRYDMYSDSICFEPEYGASQILADVFAKSKDQYLLFYTKSNNVDHLLELKNRERCVFYSTLATDNAAREFEPGAPSLDQRIQAMRRCQEAGYTVRAGFSPILPIREWRKDATVAIEKLFAKVQPDTVRLWVVSMTPVPQFDGAMGFARMDPRLSDMAIRANPEKVGGWNAPFPAEARAEIYAHYIEEIARISPGTPVSLCSESPDAWELLKDRLKMKPDHLFCCCGGLSVPRARSRSLRNRPTKRSSATR